LKQDTVTECRFEIDDPTDGSQFECHESALDSGYCMFHDPNYMAPFNVNKILQRLFEKINESISRGEPLRCIGYNLPNLRLTEDFPIPVNFSRSKFNEVDFAFSTFHEAYFISAVFSEDINLLGCSFSGEANFSNSKFLGDADFVTVQFDDNAYFTEIRFEEEVSFSGTFFQRLVAFTSSSFRGKADMRAHYIGESDFFGVTFMNEVDFGSSNFCDNVYFNGSIFYGNAYFNGVFNRLAIFENVLFKDGNSIIFDINDLSRASFINTDITRVRFSEDTFWGIENKYEIISEKFLKYSLEYLFNWDSFPQNEIAGRNLKNILKDILGDWIENLEFVKINEKKISASKPLESGNGSTINVNYKSNSYTDKDEVKDDPCREVELSPPTIDITLKGEDHISLQINNEDYQGPERLQIRNEYGRLNVYTRSYGLGKTITVYRNLRENYEYRLRYEEASEFFIREMEIRRNYREVRTNNSYEVKRNGLLRRNLSLTGIYHNLFEYGESLRKPILTLLLPLFVISFLYFLSISPPSSFDYNGLAHIANITGRTTLDMIQVEMKNPDLTDNIIRTLSLSIFASLFIPLRRRFERRFRH
jgi:uncharacterized protein YjbI with pentapeptide repeats